MPTDTLPQPTLDTRSDDRRPVAAAPTEVGRCPIRDGASMASLRSRFDLGERVFPVSKGVAVLDAETAQRLNAENYADTVLPDRLIDLLRGRTSPRVSWHEVRSAWMPVMKRLGASEHVAALELRLRAELDARLDRPLDLSRGIQEAFTRALIPTVMADLSPAERRRVVRDQDDKLDRLMRPQPREQTLPEAARSAWLQIRTGRVARRVLRSRARGRRPRRLDLADPLVDLLPRLGMDRAAHALTSVLTAVAGPPGAVAVCLLLELARRPAWRAKLTDEQAAISNAEYHEAAARAAPTTHRFVKETLRLWSAPLVLTRVARRPLAVDDRALGVDELFHLSSYFVHHDPATWPDAEQFDPDRWLPGSGRGPAHAGAFVPFGWAPTSCIGAGLGLVELMLLARLVTTVYRLEPHDLEQVEMVMASVPLPVNFRGTLRRTRADRRARSTPTT
ncbi:MAG: cytochrome P450 [Acidobacteriota bacterium]